MKIAKFSQHPSDFSETIVALAAILPPKDHTKRHCVPSDTAVVLTEHCSSSTAAPRWQGETKGLESNSVFLKRVKYIKRKNQPQLPFVLPLRLLLLPLKPRAWLVLPRNIAGFARHENKTSPSEQTLQVPCTRSSARGTLTAALYSAISRDSPKWHTCPSAPGYWMTSICAVLPPLALESLVSEISSSADTTPLCQISFSKAAAEETGYLFRAHMTHVAFILSDYCRYVSL